MQIEDRVYGAFTITEPIILELLETQALQRLKGINQFGGVNFVYPHTYQISRFEHTLGVWYVLHSVGTSLEVQVAGLLHDIGHTAFSHMIDHAMASHTEDYHERFVHQLPGYQEVQAILQKHGIVLQPTESYPEIKKPLPQVGADRLDYGLRDYFGAHPEESSPELGQKVLQSIQLEGRDIIFTDAKVAAAYAKHGIQAMWDTIYAPEVAVVYQYVTECLQVGLEEGWIKTEDILQDDEHVYELILAHAEQLPEGHRKFFTTPFTVEQVSCEGPFDVKHVKRKARYFDPTVRLANGKRVPVSDIDPVFKRFMDEMVPKFERRKEGECFKVVFHG